MTGFSQENVQSNMLRLKGLQGYSLKDNNQIILKKKLPLCPKALYLRTPLFLRLKFEPAGKA